MAFADYYGRGAVAAAQVLAGFEEAAFKRALSRPVGLSAGPEACRSSEGRSLCELAVRLLARLYPTLGLAAITDLALRDELTDLASAINPGIEIATRDCDAGVAIADGSPFTACTVYAGADAWIAHVGTERPYQVGDSSLPFGAGAAACLAAGNLFRALVMVDGAATLDRDALYSTWAADTTAENPSTLDLTPVRAVGRTALVGAGAVGQAALWALGRSPLKGALDVVDPEVIELSNLQRYVLTQRGDEATAKAELAVRALAASPLRARGHPRSWADFVAAESHHLDCVLVAVDSARDRRAIQATLPRTIINAWTQPGDLGVSTHGRFGDSSAACLVCLYLPEGEAPGEDALIAEALGVPAEAPRIRELLYQGTPAGRDLLEMVAQARRIELDRLLPYAQRSVRELYVHGFCGGGVIPLERLDATNRALHVPLAFQSALAGVQLAASYSRHLLASDPEVTFVTRLNPLAPLPPTARQPAAADTTGACICQDPEWTEAYVAKWKGPA